MRFEERTFSSAKAQAIVDKLWSVADGEAEVDDPDVEMLRAMMVNQYLFRHDAVARLAHVTDPEWQERLRMMRLPRLGAPDGG